VQVQGGTTGQLLRERGYIHSSAAQLDDVIGQAQAVRVERRTHCAHKGHADAARGWQAVSSLAAQRTLFTDITTKLGAVGAKFPVVNSLVTAIRRKKSKVRPLGPCRTRRSR
jgi:Golgi SNAP receptor complex protein 1